jgi:hypothetical protein
MAKVKKLEKAEINYKGVKYELVFNLNVMELIQEEYGSVEAWGDVVENADEPNAKAVKFGLTCMLNEGIEIYNEDHEDDEDFKPRKLLTENKVGRIITEVGLAETTEQLRKSVVDSTKSDEKN